MSNRSSAGTLLARLSVSRIRALGRAFFRLAPGSAIIVICAVVFRGLDFTPSAVSNRITEYSLAAVLAVAVTVALAITLNGLRWLLLAVWPGRLGVALGTESIVFRLGPFGTRCYDTAQVDVRYLFELPRSVAVAEDRVYESLLPAGTQIDSLVPRMTHPQARRRVEIDIADATGLSDRALADAVRPFVEYMRRGRPEPSDDDDEPAAD